MATLSNSNGRRTIQVVGDDGKRRSIRLGKCDARTALGVKLHVERLIESHGSGMPLHPDTALWLRSINDVLHVRLSKAGLCDPRAHNLRGSIPLGKMLNEYIDRRTDLKPGTLTTLKQTRDKLIAYFGANRPIGSITAAEAKDFKRHRRTSDSVGYVAKQVQIAKQFFKDAVDREILDRDPFAKIKAGSQKNPSRQRFVAREIIDRAIDAAPDLEWKLIIALSRYGGMRIPSEALALRWDDIHWAESRINVRASKTEHHVGREARETPLFPELKKLLLEAWEQAPAGTVFVINRYRSPASNLRTQFLRILKKADIEPWPKLFQNLRSTRQTELTEIWPEHVVCAWLGNTEKIAKGHYLQVTQDHFERAAGLIADSSDDQENGAKSGAATALSGSHDGAASVEPKSITSNTASTNDRMPSDAHTCTHLHMGAVGFEPTKA